MAKYNELEKWSTEKDSILDFFSYGFILCWKALILGSKFIDFDSFRSRAAWTSTAEIIFFTSLMNSVSLNLCSLSEQFGGFLVHPAYME